MLSSCYIATEKLWKGKLIQWGGLGLAIKLTSRKSFSKIMRQSEEPKQLSRAVKFNGREQDSHDEKNKASRNFVYSTHSRQVVRGCTSQQQPLTQ